MAKLSAFFSALVAASIVVATPVARGTGNTLPISVNIFHNSSTGTFVEAERRRAQQIIQHGRGRAAARKNSKRADTGNVGVINGVVHYVASVGVGSPATNYSLLIDTGSSNTWLGADKPYKHTSTSKSTGKPISVSYGSGSFSGTEFTDRVTLSSSLVIQNQSIGVASQSEGIDGFDGILGIGPVDLTEDTVLGTSSVPTVTDNLFSAGAISTNEVGILFNPAAGSDSDGVLTFGGVDSSAITGSVAFTSKTGTSPANEYWGIDESITYGSTSILSSTAGIVDTGTTLVLIATDAFNKYMSATGATLDNNTGLLKVSNVNNLQNLNFIIGGKTYALTPNAQLFPRSLNSQIGGDADGNYLIVADLGSDSGAGLDFINGYTFLERYYSVFNSANGQVGFAATPSTNATSN